MKKYLFLGLTFLLGTTLSAQTDAEKVRSTVFKKDIESHVYFLASDELKGRQTGSSELDIAAAYIANQLRKYGVKPSGENGTFYQNVPMENLSAPDAISLRVNEIELDTYMAHSVRNIDFSGEAVYLEYGNEQDFENKDLSGKIVIVKGGSPELQDARSMYRLSKTKKEMAKNAGAIGLVELVDIEEKTWNRYDHYFNYGSTSLKAAVNEDTSEKFIHIWLMDEKMKASASIASSKKLNTDLTIKGIKTENISSRNVVGYLEGSDPKLKDEFIIYSAHYDHVGIGAPNAENDSIFNGARDNAIGTVTVISAAENLAKYPTKRSSLFILFTGEEKGLLGSKYYTENPMMPLNKMVYCFNSDNGGYNDTSKVTIFGLNRTTVAQHIIDGAKEFDLEAIDDPAPEQNLFDRSDNVNFAKKGIPAPTYSLGFTAFDEEVTKTYHQVTDNPDTVDYDYLEKFFRSYVLTCRMISDDLKTPFWTEGDKYYKAGVNLYSEKEEEEASVLD